MLDPDEAILRDLQAMARRGESVTSMFNSVKQRLGGSPHILDVLVCFRKAFYLSLLEVKSIGALSRSEDRSITDESLLEKLVMPAIPRLVIGMNGTRSVSTKNCLRPRSRFGEGRLVAERSFAKVAPLLCLSE